MDGCLSRAGMLAAMLIALTVLAPVPVATQEQFQFVVSARDADGHAVTDLKTDEVVMLENGVANQIVKVEPFHVPVKLTIAVDNGLRSGEALAHYRSGLEGLVDALQPEIEVALITMAPQPRILVQSTLDRSRLRRGLNGFAPEQATPRFADTIVEFSKRLQDEFNKTKRFDSLPVLLLISTTSSETTSYQNAQIGAAVGFLQTRKTKIYATMTTTQGAQGQQPLLAIQLTKATGGRYESLSNTSRLATLLPEYGVEIAALHQQRYNQLLVTALRKGVKGQLQNPRIELTRPSVTGTVSIDGLP